MPALSAVKRSSVKSVVNSLRRVGYVALAAASASFVAPAVAQSDAARLACVNDGNASFYSEATQTCIKFSGYVWAEGYFNTYANYPSANDKYYGIGTLGLKSNTVTQTDAGELRTFVNLRFRGRSANEWSDGPKKFSLVPWEVYFQYGGLTVGHRQSMFDFYANANVQGTDPGTVGDFEKVLLAAYTQSLGNGWNATLSIEAPWVREGGINAANANSVLGFNQNTKTPDFVGVVTNTGKWGEFQLSGALHRVKTKTFATPAVGYTGSPESEIWGYAVQAGVVFDFLPLSVGNSLYLQAAWADGATTYLGLINASGAFMPPDAYIGANGSMSRVSGWNMTAQYLYNWTPTLQSAVFGGYAKFYLNNREASYTYGATGGANYNLGVNLTWTPIKSLSLVAQYQYNMYMANNYVNTGNGLPRQAQGAHQALIMVQQSF